MFQENLKNLIQGLNFYLRQEEFLMVLVGESSTGRLFF